MLVSVKIIRFNKLDYLIGQLFQRIQKFIRRKPEIAVRRFRTGKRYAAEICRREIHNGFWNNHSHGVTKDRVVIFDALFNLLE